MDTATKTQNEDRYEELVETKHYTFSPSISKRRMVGGKTYYVRSYFTGEKDFHETVKRLATRQAYDKHAEWRDMRQEKQIIGLYMRLSQEDERQGESLSIDNQRHILRKYAEERGWEIYDEYIDDGVSGTTFNRPEVQRLLDDAKTGVINTIIVKDLSRFGRNYIEVGQYLDYVFPAFGIRFIAIQDNVDTANRDSGAMEMMPIMNVLNEWHAANTSKKISLRPAE